jgi:uncharacterized protein YecT (DUF1311 family)
MLAQHKCEHASSQAREYAAYGACASLESPKADAKSDKRWQCVYRKPDQQQAEEAYAQQSQDHRRSLLIEVFVGLDRAQSAPFQHRV